MKFLRQSRYSRLFLWVVMAAMGIFSAARWVRNHRPPQYHPAHVERPADPVRESPPRACDVNSPCLAIVVDDIGRDMAALQELLQLKWDLTYAVLPHAKDTARSVDAIKARAREMIVHVPMEPLDTSHLSDESVILTADRPLAPLLAECLAQVPGAVGINNHMGSALTRMPDPLAQIMDVLEPTRLWILDSKTIADSKMCDVAVAHHIPCRQRDLFLDQLREPAKIMEAVNGAAQLARQRGWAIAIGHPYPETLAAMKQLLEQGVDLPIRRLSRVYLGAGTL